MRPIQRLACLLHFHSVPVVDVQGAALQELEDSPGTSELVALTLVRRDTAGTRDLVDAALRSPNLAAPSELVAAKTVAHEVAQRILGETVSPVDGAWELWKMARQVPDLELELAGFAGLASQHEDDAERRAEYERDILLVAQELLDSGALAVRQRDDGQPTCPPAGTSLPPASS